MVKKLFVFNLLLLAVLGCNNNALKPDDFSKESIDKKYPYWQVGIESFEIASELSKYTTITVDEKKYMLICMALIRLAVNTDEFASRIKAADAELGSSVNDSYDGQELKVGEKYNAQKVIDTVRSLKYDFVYRKMNTAAGVGTGEMGKSRYLRHGLQPENQIPTGRWVGFSSGNWGSIDSALFGNYSTYMESQAYANTAGLMFHEHMHNIGFHHVGKYKVPYTLQGVVTDILNQILWKDAINGTKPSLKNKYEKQVNELIAYYLTEYKYLLNEDTVFDPSQK
ncbi:hypothetical protein [Brachyspira hampsonii]|uniref:Uncharacterized protein n=1 Tax=Brachyspira hampsonii TaxID=1287055 RepID=A0AAC9XK17_9SPIR|nr:hypothetical protein [Brachyspira hampsonii]ASJ20833.1 hypothetical protein BHAMNSH16_03890 [Brachyspira hampsonii]ELV04882.1 hypothetical protein H263_13498 [Brachyspira hampsonii 30599]MBW5380267.1 hypothetical protein [Brachyspira hampsonii]OEJ18968.1 hypothetical protein A9496_06065 [Brachyspira hampsonii]